MYSYFLSTTSFELQRYKKTRSLIGCRHQKKTSDGFSSKIQLRLSASSQSSSRKEADFHPCGISCSCIVVAIHDFYSADVRKGQRPGMGGTVLAVVITITLKFTALFPHLCPELFFLALPVHHGNCVPFCSVTGPWLFSLQYTSFPFLCKYLSMVLKPFCLPSRKWHDRLLCSRLFVLHEHLIPPFSYLL